MDKSNKPELPYFDNFEKTLLAHYAKLNNNLNYQIVEQNKSSKNKAVKRDSLRLTGNEEMKDKCVRILEVFRVTIEDKIISLLPGTPIRTDKNVKF